MRRLALLLAVLLGATTAFAAEGPNGAYVKTDYVLFPIPASVNPMVVTDANGYLVVTNNAQTAPVGPARPMSNTPMVTDASNYLMVACSGCTPATTANLQIASLGLGVAASTTTGTIKALAPLIVFPASDTTSAIQFTRTDGSTSVMTMDTTANRSVGIGMAPGASTSSLSVNGSVIFGGNSLGVNGSTGHTIAGPNFVIGWSAAGISITSLTPDTAFGRNAAGVVEVNNGTAGTFRDIKVRTLNVTSGEQNNGVATILNVASNFTTAANTNLQTITGLTAALPASTALNVPFQCKLIWSQATAAVAVSFGVQSDTVTPTNLMALGQMETNVTVTSYGDIVAIASTTAQTVVTGTPAATATTYNAYLDGYLENPSNASVTNLNIMVKTAVGGDAVTVYRGSFCRLF